MGSPLHLRRYRPDDRPRVQEIMVEALRDADAYFEGVPDEIDKLQAAHRRGDGEFLVGEVDGKIVATGAYRPPTGLAVDVLESIPEGTAELKRMHVAPDYQRRGYGQRMLDTLQRRAHDGGYTTLVLATTDLQPAAQRFYEANGFTRVHSASMNAFEISFDLLVYQQALADSI